MALVKFVSWWEEYRERLESSNTSGPYYVIYEGRDGQFVPSRFGLNDAPYKPLLNVVVSGPHYVIEVRDEIVRSLRSRLVAIGGIELEKRVAKFVEAIGIDNTVVIGIGWCAVDTISYETIHRFRKIIVLDKRYARDPFAERKARFEAVRAQLDNDKRVFDEIIGRSVRVSVYVDNPIDGQFAQSRRVRVGDSVVESEDWFDFVALNGAVIAKLDFSTIYVRGYEHADVTIRNTTMTRPVVVVVKPCYFEDEDYRDDYYNVAHVIDIDSLNVTVNEHVEQDYEPEPKDEANAG